MSRSEPLSKVAPCLTTATSFTSNAAQVSQMLVAGGIAVAMAFVGCGARALVVDTGSHLVLLPRLDRTSGHSPDSGRVSQRYLGRHAGLVVSLAFTPDGKIVASGGTDRKIKIWDVRSGTQLRDLAPLEGPVYSLSFSPDGNVLASGVHHHKIILWSTATWTPVCVLKHEFSVNGLSYTPDGKAIASGTSGGTVRLWTADGKRLLWRAEGHGSVTSVRVSPDGDIVATAHADRLVRLWKRSTGHLLGALKGHTAAVTSVSFSPDGKLLATAGADRAIRIWSLRKRVTIRRLSMQTAVESVAFSPDGESLAGGGHDETVLWNTSRWNEGATYRHPGIAFALAFSPDSAILATALGRSGAVVLQAISRLPSAR